MLNVRSSLPSYIGIIKLGRIVFEENANLNGDKTFIETYSVLLLLHWCLCGVQEEEEEEEVTHKHDGRTFEEALVADIDLIVDFAAGLKHQVQFRDQQLLNALEREGAGFLWFAKACIEKERRMNSTRSPRLPTWEKSTSSAMFYRARTTST